MKAERLRELAALMREEGLVELEVEEGASRVRLRRPEGPIPTAAAAAPTPAERALAEEADAAPEPEGVVVRAPMVGTFYRAPRRGAPPFVEVGDEVVRGQVLCIIEAMKFMNEIESPAAGRVVEIYVENEAPVQYGDALLRIVPGG